MYYLIPKDAPGFDSLDALALHIDSSGRDLTHPKIDPAAHLVVKGIAQRLVAQLVLEPLTAAAPKPARDPNTDEQQRDAVLVYVRSAPGPVTVAEVAKECGCTTGDVSRYKAALIKAGELDANAKKGTLAAKRVAA